MLPRIRTWRSGIQSTNRYHRLSGVEVKGTSDKSSFKVPTQEELPDNVVYLFEQRQSSCDKTCVDLKMGIVLILYGYKVGPTIKKKEVLRLP